MSYGSNSLNLVQFAHHPRYRFVRGDISNPKTVSRVLRNTDADAVVNFAAQTHVDRSIANPTAFFSANALGTFTLLEEVRKSNKETLFLQVGTDEVYGEIESGSFREDATPIPSSPYAATKAAADLLALAYNKTYGMKTIVTRCTNNFGPYQFPEKLIPKIIICALLNREVPIYGSGRQVRDWIFVEDHCRAIERVVSKGKAGSIYNVAGRNEFTNLEIAQRVLDLMQRPVSLIKHVSDRPGHDRRYSLNDKRIRSEIGWKPRHSFSSALKRTIHWYEKNEAWWRWAIRDEVLAAEPWRVSQGSDRKHSRKR